MTSKKLHSAAQRERRRLGASWWAALAVTVLALVTTSPAPTISGALPAPDDAASDATRGNSEGELGDDPLPSSAAEPPEVTRLPDAGVPGPHTTGVPAGTQLTRFDGDLVITTPGAVVEGLDIYGFVRVEAPGVTIRNSIIRGRSVANNAMLIYAGSPSATGLLVHDTELAAAYPSHIVNGVYGAGFTLRRVNIHTVIDSVHIFGDDVVIESSWLHGNLHYDNDPGWGGGPSHDDNIQIQAGTNITITGNVIEGAHNAALQVTQDQGPVSQLVFSGNTVSGGGCSINIAEKNKGAIEGLHISDNVFGESRFGCAMLIPPSTHATISANASTNGAPVRIDRRAQ
ncbi:hypothetical protein [Homoserinimonas hongtaonis]|uniref:Right handed beta helix domain-containing protein n=1 Tax=Homoserinimonas hongtaonis TaxID=2079791 RepID=A0A2U1T135_9MICO|nr:hypothetical protein [Salinibacterium hongtaonis]PWB97576.1 hypothetical protein DF220_06845 [Salinibacterium hongtaonis]